MIVHDPVSFFSCQSLNPDECLADIEITEQIIIDSIQELSSTSSAGPDGVPSTLLLKCAAELAPALKLMFSQSLTHGFIPSSLKRAAITPVFKSGTKTSPSNYRPISLTSTIIKVFERIIRKQVVAFMNRQGHTTLFQKWSLMSCCLPTPMALASGGESDVPACGPPASFSVHLASSAVTPAGSVHKSRGDNVVRMWVQLKR